MQLFPQPVAHEVMDLVAQRIGHGQSTAEIRQALLDRGMSEYNAYLCFKAAQLLLNTGFYDKPMAPISDPFKS
jgi:hypothetical protein